MGAGWVDRGALAGSYFSDLSEALEVGCTARRWVQGPSGSWVPWQSRGPEWSRAPAVGSKDPSNRQVRRRVCWSAGRSLGGHYCYVHDGTSKQAHHIRHLAAHKRDSTNKAPSTVQLPKTRAYRPPGVLGLLLVSCPGRGGVWHAQYEHRKDRPSSAVGSIRAVVCHRAGFSPPSRL